MTARLFNRPNRSSIFFSLCVAITMSCLLMSGCNESAPPVDELVVALSAGPSTLDPRLTTDATGSRLAGLLFSSLVRIDRDLKPVGEAAADWTHDGLEYTFHLRPGLKFSNGRALTTDDIDFTFKEFLSSKSPFASALSVIEKVTAVYEADKREVKIKLRSPSATILGDLSTIKFIPHKESEAPDFARHPIGTGPFSLKAIDANEIRLETAGVCPYAKPLMHFALFKIIRDDQTRFNKINKGEVDLEQQELPPDKIPQLEKNSELSVYKYPGLAMTYLLLNLHDPLLAKLQTRLGLSYAIDRVSMIEHKLAGLAVPAVGLLTPSNPYFNSSLIPPRAQALMAKAAVDRLSSLTGVGTGEFVLKTSATPSAVENGKVIAEQMREAGFKVSMQSFEWGTFFGDVQNSRFQIALMRWVGTIDPDLYRKALHSRELPPTGRNRGFYANPQVDKLVEEGARTEDFIARKRIYDEVQRLVLDDMPIIPLWYDTEVTVVNKRVHGYQPMKDGSFWPLTEVSKAGAPK